MQYWSSCAVDQFQLTCDQLEGDLAYTSAMFAGTKTALCFVDWMLDHLRQSGLWTAANGRSSSLLYMWKTALEIRETTISISILVITAVQSGWSTCELSLRVALFSLQSAALRPSDPPYSRSKWAIPNIQNSQEIGLLLKVENTVMLDTLISLISCLCTP